MPTEETTMGRITLEFEIANNRDVELAAAGAITPDQVRRATLRASWTPARLGSSCPNPLSTSSA
jgi:hypothetical protein